MTAAHTRAHERTLLGVCEGNQTNVHETERGRPKRKQTRAAGKAKCHPRRHPSVSTTKRVPTRAQNQTRKPTRSQTRRREMETFRNTRKPSRGKNLTRKPTRNRLTHQTKIKRTAETCANPGADKQVRHPTRERAQKPTRRHAGSPLSEAKKGGAKQVGGHRKGSKRKKKQTRKKDKWLNKTADISASESGKNGSKCG